MKKFLPGLLATVGIVLFPMSAAVSATPAGAASVAHTVPLNCAAEGGDTRSSYDASVQPGIIVTYSYGYGIPNEYQAEGWAEQDGGFILYLGNGSDEFTKDHLVSAWMSSTDCLGNDDISRNAWIADSTGHVFGEDVNSGPPTENFGDASNLKLNQPIVGMTPTADGQGYWLVAADGGIFDYGDAGFDGSAGSIHLNQPIVGMSVTPDGGGYTLVATDGGVFNYGDSHFYGSLPGVLKPGQTLNSPIEGIVNTPDGGGYWMVAADGGVFCFGDAPFLGSEGGADITSPIAGMLPNGNGYTLVAQDGNLYRFS